jgi:LPS sulfotransferase NodH
MAGIFDYFVVFAEMRTGSNFLETNLNAFDGIACHGEAFNPHFLGYPKTKEILGISQGTRDADPMRLLKEIKDQPDALGGFRYFHDHDPRILDHCLDDSKCAKIILTRNPLDSYVSWKIAQETGQWKLTDSKSRKDGQADFDADEFNAHLEALQDFQVELLNRLQTSGQTAFYISYEDLQSVEVMNGLARYLGVDEQLEALDKNLKKQNPSPISKKVRNFAQMQTALSGLDQFNLTRTPNFEPRRGPAIPTYVAAAEAGLLYLPIKGGPEEQVLDWLAAVDGTTRDRLHSKFSQKDLRQWKRKHSGHRSFTVLRHPVARAHHAFCKHILGTGAGSYAALRQTLRRRYALPIPEDMPDDGYDRIAHRTAFAAFLVFLKGNITGQTAIRVDASWCTQTQALQGFGEFALPDRVVRESDLEVEFAQLLTATGHSGDVVLGPSVTDEPFGLSEIYDAEIEKLAQDVYRRDYMMFGFESWR